MNVFSLLKGLMKKKEDEEKDTNLSGCSVTWE